MGFPSSLARRAPSSARERMPSLPEIIEIVIGVEAHVQTHSAVVVDARPGGVLGKSEPQNG
jgi:hypothetical protein